jgi:hypothetical protein
MFNMLTHRTNVLLSPIEYSELKKISLDQNKTLGELIRQAIRKTYKIKSDESNSVDSTLANIRLLTNDAKLTGINYRELVKSGRKYE